ncbi:hypothetical protein NDU88_000907 [Pleurodeles waltl]|uniref:Uncharacterized protein n=1 Tax=Pleurodeles waltl TaxID=8319 RepID=A0AAV7S9E3_PLEWA|nr:hypothetical protein NDU88_000907 [Pleurodeles waltl]
MCAADQPVSPRGTASPSHADSSTDPTRSRRMMGHTHQQPGRPSVVGGRPRPSPHQASTTPCSDTPLRCVLFHQPARLRPRAPSPSPAEPLHGLKSSGPLQWCQGSRKTCNPPILIGDRYWNRRFYMAGIGAAD